MKLRFFQINGKEVFPVLLLILVIQFVIGCEDSTTDPVPAAEVVTFSFSTYDFGNVAVRNDAEVTLVITNKTFNNIKITNIDDDYVDALVFTADFNNMVDVMVKPDSSYSVKLYFTPEAAQSYSATLTVETDNENFASTDITLTGNGTGPVQTTWDNYIGSFLDDKCTPCHTSGASGGFSMLSYVNAMRGNRIVPNDADGSLIVRRIEGTSGDRMPQGGPYLSDEEIGVIRAWIVDGAPEN